MPPAISLPPVETFENQYPHRDYEIKISAPEFTSVCPKTGLPDFGEITVIYTPDRLVIELKAFKYYLLGFRTQGIFYENVVNRILDDLSQAIAPRAMTVIGDFSSRGGIRTRVEAIYKPGD